MESVCITEDLSVNLETPQCELRWDGCDDTAVAGIRIHGCAFYYACQHCKDAILQRIGGNFYALRNRKCKSCGLRFMKKDYFQVIPLDKEKNA